MEFYKRAALVLKCVPRGKIVTYGQIALLCGKPGNSRQVGYGLGKNLMERIFLHIRWLIPGESCLEQRHLKLLICRKYFWNKKG